MANDEHAAARLSPELVERIARLLAGEPVSVTLSRYEGSSTYYGCSALVFRAGTNNDVVRSGTASGPTLDIAATGALDIVEGVSGSRR